MTDSLSPPCLTLYGRVHENNNNIKKKTREKEKNERTWGVWKGVTHSFRSIQIRLSKIKRKNQNPRRTFIAQKEENIKIKNVYKIIKKKGKERVREREKRKMREKRWKSRSVSMATDPFSQLTVDKSIGAMLGPGTLRRGLIEAGLPLLFLFFSGRSWKERRAWENRKPSKPPFSSLGFFSFLTGAARFRY